MIEDVTLTPAMVAREFTQAFGERSHAAACLLVRAVRELGPDAAYDLAARALFIEATGGLPLGEPWNRKRTPGGVFFFLLKDELDDEQHRRVFGRVRKRNGTKPEPVIETPAPELVKLAKPPKLKAPQPAPDPSRPCAACEQPTVVVGKFHFGRAGKRYLCAPCVDTLGFVFSPDGAVQQLQEQAA